MGEIQGIKVEKWTAKVATNADQASSRTSFWFQHLLLMPRKKEGNNLERKNFGFGNGKRQKWFFSTDPFQIHFRPHESVTRIHWERSRTTRITLNLQGELLSERMNICSIRWNKKVFAACCTFRRWVHVSFRDLVPIFPALTFVSSFLKKGNGERGKNWARGRRNPFSDITTHSPLAGWYREKVERQKQCWIFLFDSFQTLLFLNWS